MTKKWYLLVFLYLFSYKMDAQNLVPNGDFEEYTHLPDGLDRLNYCVGWLNPNYGSSPDYFHTLGSGAITLPNTLLATVYPFSGKAIAGIHLTTPNNYREYIACKLISKLIVGKQYSFSFAYTNGGSNIDYGAGSDHFGVHFSKNLPISYSGNELPGSPQLEIDGVCWDTNWRVVSFTFIADSAYQYLTIGNFHQDNQTIVINEITSIHPNDTYYFIDRIVLTKNIFPVSIEIPNVFTPNNDEVNDTFHPVQAIGIENYELIIYNRWDQKVFQTTDVNQGWDGTFNQEKCTDGTYFWTVNYLDVNDKKGIKKGFLELNR